VPALRERRDDILPLARFLLDKHREQEGLPRVALSADAARHLTGYDWGGNIRELDNAMQRAAILAGSAEVTAAELMLGGGFAEDSLPAASAGDDADIKTLEKRHILETLSQVGGVRKMAAERLGISERTLRYKLQRYRDGSE